MRLTTDSADDIAPSWSRDGKWVYFPSKRTSRYEVWKVPAGGGEAVQVSRNGGGPALESSDGKSVYYTKGAFWGSLWKMPVSGGEESQVLPSVAWDTFSFVSDGIYFIPEPGTRSEVFHPVSELRHRQGENGGSDVRTTIWGALCFTGRPVHPVLAGR
jgi:hypothetical protein